MKPFRIGLAVVATYFGIEVVNLVFGLLRLAIGLAIVAGLAWFIVAYKCGDLPTGIKTIDETINIIRCKSRVHP